MGMINIIPSKPNPNHRHRAEENKNLSVSGGSAAPGLMAPPIKYKRRRVSAVRRFPKGCGPAAAAGKPNAVPQPDPIRPSQPESQSDAGTTAAPHPAAATSDTTSSLQPISKPVLKEQSLLFLNPQSNLRVLPKRRKISAVRKFPAGCGRAAATLSKAQQETKRPDEASKPVTSDNKSFIVENTTADNNAGEKTQERAQESVLVGDQAHESDQESVLAGEQVQEKAQESVLAEGYCGEGTGQVSVLAEGCGGEEKGQELVLVEGYGGGEPMGGVRVNELSEEIKQSPSCSNGRAQSGGKKASSVKTRKNSKLGSVASEALGDRLIVQCLMATPNCPWRSRSQSAAVKGSCAGMPRSKKSR